MKLLNDSFQNSTLFENSIEPLSRNRNLNLTQNEYVQAICDVVSGENVKTIERYAALNFEAASFSSF